MEQDCVFCKIVAGTEQTNVIWEDDKHMAFLTRWPNTEGFSVVITKEHYPSYAFDAPEQVMLDLVVAAKKVAQKIDAAYDDVGRTGLIMEGFGVNHLHYKLFPMHGTNEPEWKARIAKSDRYFDQYEGYIATNSAPEEKPEVLEQIAKKIRGDV